MTDERMPPQSKDAERAVLGSMLRDNTVIDDIVPILSDGHFYFDGHRKIFKGILALHERGRPADLTTLAEHLKEQKQIEDVGGYAYLGGLWDAAPTAANAEYYARIVRDRALQRGLIRVGNEIVRDTYDHVMPADELVANAEQKIFQLAEEEVVSQVATIGEGLRQACDLIDYWQTRDRTGAPELRTGFIDIDQKAGGLTASELTVIAARPSVGKTCLALNFARHIAVEQERPLFFVSLEQSTRDLNLRLLSCQARVDRVQMRTTVLSKDDTDRLTAAREILSLAQSRFFIDEAKCQNVLRIAANARRLKRRHGIAAVFIDYLGLIEPESRRDPRHEQVGATMRRLKILAGELKLPVVVMAQLNREPEGRPDHKPRLSDLRESGAVEQDADVVLLLHQDGDEGKSNGIAQIVVNVAKNRNGPTGEVRLAFLKRFMRFENSALDSPFTGQA